MLIRWICLYWQTLNKEIPIQFKKGKRIIIISFALSLWLTNNTYSETKDGTSGVLSSGLGKWVLCHLHSHYNIEYYEIFILYFQLLFIILRISFHILSCLFQFSHFSWILESPLSLTQSSSTVPQTAASEMTTLKDLNCSSTTVHSSVFKHFFAHTDVLLLCSQRLNQIKLNYI